MIRIENLKKYFISGGGFFGGKTVETKAVDGVSLHIKKGETVGLVGESGCGKSTLGRCILRLIEPDAGKIFLDKKDLLSLNGRELRKYRRKMQIIFQDPYGSLNPRMRIGKVLEEALWIHNICKKNELRDQACTLLEEVGLRADNYHRFPHQLSGGQRQRVGIARALAVQPEFIIADEPTSALDVSIQAQILNLLMELKEKRKLSYLFITHDLRVVEHISDRIILMYLGKIVEEAPTKTFFSNPLHPYAHLLLNSVPRGINEEKNKKPKAKKYFSGEKVKSGCSFYPRCPKATEKCRQKQKLKEIEKSHFIACENPISGKR